MDTKFRPLVKNGHNVQWISGSPRFDFDENNISEWSFKTKLKYADRFF